MYRYRYRYICIYIYIYIKIERRTIECQESKTKDFNIFEQTVVSILMSVVSKDPLHMDVTTDLQ